MKTLLKFIVVILLSLLVCFLLSSILFQFRLLWSAFSLIGLTVLLIPLLAWRAIPNPAGRLAYIPAVILPSIPFLATLPEWVSYGWSYWAAFVTSLFGVLICVLALKYGGRFIYGSKIT